MKTALQAGQSSGKWFTHRRSIPYIFLIYLYPWLPHHGCSAICLNARVQTLLFVSKAVSPQCQIYIHYSKITQQKWLNVRLNSRTYKVKSAWPSLSLITYYLWPCPHLLEKASFSLPFWHSDHAETVFSVKEKAAFWKLSPKQIHFKMPRRSVDSEPEDLFENNDTF